MLKGMLGAMRIECPSEFACRLTRRSLVITLSVLVALNSFRPAAITLASGPGRTQAAHWPVQSILPPPQNCAGSELPFGAAPIRGAGRCWTRRCAVDHRTGRAESRREAAFLDRRLPGSGPAPRESAAEQAHLGVAQIALPDAFQHAVSSKG